MRKLTATEIYALVFGGFLGLCIWKFGNPVILDHVIQAPKSWNDFLNDAWPIHWANGLLLILSLWAGILGFRDRRKWVFRGYLWLWPLIWLGWQFISALQTQDKALSAATLWQFSGCVACYFIGAMMIGIPQSMVPLAPSPPSSSKAVATNTSRAFYLLLVGVLAAFTICLVRGANQRLFEFPLSYQLMVEGERAGWTNYPPETVAEMKAEKIIIYTNDVAVANPLILEKFRKGRVSGTMVYPNALAGLILLLFPLSLVLAITATRSLKCLIRVALVTLTIVLGSSVFIWTGSKLGWLIGMGVVGSYLMRIEYLRKYKVVAIATFLIVGLGIFSIRFQQYFAKGATSVGARFDYWHAAVKTTIEKPVLGSGPGTFQRPYEKLKAPNSEMARLAHNDYLEQFSDSGIAGGMSYLIWIGSALFAIGKRAIASPNALCFALYLGLMAWFMQGVGEFGLYIPGSAWLAFTLLGCLAGIIAIKIDKKATSASLKA